jgi:hypothetical protein
VLSPSDPFSYERQVVADNRTASLAVFVSSTGDANITAAIAVAMAPVHGVWLIEFVPAPTPQNYFVFVQSMDGNVVPVHVRVGPASAGMIVFVCVF